MFTIYFSDQGQFDTFQAENMGTRYYFSFAEYDGNAFQQMATLYDDSPEDDINLIIDLDKWEFAVQVLDPDNYGKVAEEAEFGDWNSAIDCYKAEVWKRTGTKYPNTFEDATIANWISGRL